MKLQNRNNLKIEILSMLNNNISRLNICKTLGVSNGFISKIIIEDIIKDVAIVNSRMVSNCFVELL